MNKLSVVVDVLNKEKDLERCLTSIKDLAGEIVVCDEGSTDGSVSVAKRFGAKVIHHKKVAYVELLRNFEVSEASGDWILILDPDEELSSTLAKKIKEIIKSPKADYYRIPRKNIIFGKWMEHARWWPDHNIRLFKKGHVSWNEIIHGVPITTGEGKDLPAEEKLAIIHHHYNSVSEYIERLNRYTNVQAKLKVEGGYKFKWTDLISKPVDEFFGRFYMGKGYRDGVHGLALSLLQAFSELVVYSKIWEKDKFPVDKPSLTEINNQFKKKGKDLRYWQADSVVSETGSLTGKFRRKLKI